jgi:protein-S-isoprenylcysteine O-methyltransferase Ste14
MPLQSYAIFLAFTILGVATALHIMALRSKGIRLTGKSTIDPFYFISGKISLYACWAFFFIKAILPTIGYISVPDYVAWLGIGLLYVGCLLLILSLYSMGDSLIVGLPDNPLPFKTNGLYKYSRNPIYMSVFTISTASCICFPDLLNVSFAIYGMVVHHSIIQGEETFMSRKFGEDWALYAKQVNRYI